MASRPCRAESPAPVSEPGTASLTAISWAPHEELAIAHWVAQGRWLGALGRASGWWIGDWIRYGNARYGERYVPAAKVTGYDVHSLMNMAWVAGRFGVERRRPGLSFSHHAELAGLPEEEQEIWLDRAELGALSGRAVRRELREARRRRAARLARAARPRHVVETAYEGAAVEEALLELAPATAPAAAGPAGPARPRGEAAPARSKLGHEVVCPVCGHHFDDQAAG